MTTTGSSIDDALARFFEADEWPYSPLDDGGGYRLWFQGRNGRFPCIVRVRPEHSQVVFYSVLPVQVPEDRRPAVAELVTRVNYTLVIGNLEMDYRDGEVRYRTSADVEGVEVTDALIKPLLYANVLTADRYVPIVAAVAAGETTPEAALEEAEDG